MNINQDAGRSNSGLEGHLRSLILTNTPEEAQSNGTSACPAPPTSFEARQSPGHNSPGTQASPLSTSQNDSPQSPRSIKKRPNQAQRRQMSSQLSIPVDPRVQSTSIASAPLHPARGQQWGQSPHQPRHLSTLSQSSSQSSSPGLGRGGSPSHHFHRYQGHHHPTSNDRFQPPGQRRQSEPLFLNQDQQSPGGWRRGSAQPAAHTRRPMFHPEEISNQASLLDRLCYNVVSNSEIQRSEIAEKEAFRLRIEDLIRRVITNYEQEQAQRWDFPYSSIELKCFGSLSSGFATKASDMDLALISPLSRVQPDDKGSPIPRLIEKTLLEAGIGARLLTRTRVPIIKLCEHPPKDLFQDLVEQREKWEHGASTEQQEDQDDDEHEAGDQKAKSSEKDLEHEQKNASRADGEAEEDTTFTVPTVDGLELQQFYLRQTPGSSLATYYGTAKRVLRKAGIHDVRQPSAHTFTAVQWEILNKICEAFVRGLADKNLRQKLEAYPSLSFSSTSGSANHHSLAGVFAQIEGEYVLQQWSEWMIKEGLEMDPQAEGPIRMWKQCQHKSTAGSDPVGFSKEAHNILDRVRTIPSLQLATLQQGQDETPVQYHSRTLRIISSLDRRLIFPRGVTASAVNRYVSGINLQEVKTAVSEFIAGREGSMTLNTVARRHKSLQLARSFARGLQKGSFDLNDQEDIRAYIDILEAPMRRLPQHHEQFDLVVPISQKSARLLAKIKSLPDPHPLASDQGKNRYKDHLEFPKTGAGVQCDINFSAHLALQNTILLRCYAHSDPRVRPMVLFIKHWAKMRGINSGYRGTLSSYGYVLMVLHYLVNVVQPFVCPNLQQLAPPPPPNAPPSSFERAGQLRGYNVQFWRNEEEIMHLARNNQLNGNNQSLGHLLRGFFEYFAQSGPMSIGSGKGFDWGRDVLSLRTAGGLLSKQEKGWTGAKTVYQTQTPNDSPGFAPDAAGANPGAKDEQTSSVKPQVNSDDVKEVRLRYLFAIEDPFELEHNVARTVTHNGIVSIRDEFRRAWRLIKAAGHGEYVEELLGDVNEEKKTTDDSLASLLHEIHGPFIFEDENTENDSV